MAPFFFAIVVSVAFSAIASWMAAERSSDNVLRTVSVGGVSAFLTIVAVFGLWILTREPPEFPKLSPTEELAITAFFLGGPAAIGGFLIGGMCLIFRKFNARRRR